MEENIWQKKQQNFFEMVLNNSSEITKEMKLEIYKTLDLEGRRHNTSKEQQTQRRAARR